MDNQLKTRVDDILKNIKHEQPDNTIKEKLNLHLKLKRRVNNNNPEGIAAVPFESNLHARNPYSLNNNSSSSSSSSTLGTPNTVQVESKPVKKTKMVSNKKSKQSKQNIGHCNSLLNVSVADGSVVQNSLSGDVIDKEDGSSCTIPDKKPKTPDILTVVLNQKKMSLMQDPEILKFIERLTQLKK